MTSSHHSMRFNHNILIALFFTFGRSSGAYLSLLIARDRDIDGVIDFYGYSGINTEPFKMANSYYAKTAQSVNETVLAQLTSPTPIIQDQIA